MATIKKPAKKYADGGPVTTTTKTTKKPKTVSQRIGDLTMRDLKNSAETAMNLSTLGGYGLAKKGIKKLTGLKTGGTVKKAKSGGSFPDLNKDGKVTKADILKGRGVIAQKGATVKKKTGMDALKDLGKYVSTGGLATEKYNPAPSTKAKKTMKSGGKMKKCKTGCN